MIKTYKIKPTKKQLSIMKEYWQRFQSVSDYFYRSIGELEREMSKKTGIKDLEFFHDQMCTGWVGIGNLERSMRLLQREELECN